MRTGRLLTNYCHRQNRLGLEKINLTYCPLIREQNNENWKLKTPSLHPQFFFQAHLQSWFFSPHSFRWCRATGVCNAQSLPLLPHTFPSAPACILGFLPQDTILHELTLHRQRFKKLSNTGPLLRVQSCRNGLLQHGSHAAPHPGSLQHPWLLSSFLQAKPTCCSVGVLQRLQWGPSGFIWNLCSGAWRASCPSPPQTWESAGLFLSHFSLSSVSHVSQSISYPFLNKLPLRAQAASLFVTPGYKNLAT